MKDLALDLLNLVITHCHSECHETAYNALQEIDNGFCLKRSEYLNIVKSCLDDLQRELKQD